MLRKCVKRVGSAMGLLMLSAGQSVWAALPVPVAPSTAPAAGDWIGLIEGYIKDGGLVLGSNSQFGWVAERQRPAPVGFTRNNDDTKGADSENRACEPCSVNRICC